MFLHFTIIHYRPFLGTFKNNFICKKLINRWCVIFGSTDLPKWASSKVTCFYSMMVFSLRKKFNSHLNSSHSQQKVGWGGVKGVNSKWRNQSVSLEWNGECYRYWSFIPSTWERWSASWRVLISDRRYQTVRRDRPVCLYSCRLAVCELGPGSKSLAESEGPVRAWDEMRCHLITLCT